MIRSDVINGVEIRYNAQHTHKVAVKSSLDTVWTLLRMSHVLVERRARLREGLPKSSKVVKRLMTVDQWLNAAD